jgi:SOUL heme-binding protein
MTAILSWFSLSRLTAPILCALVLTGCSMFGVRSGYEQAPYTVIDRIAETTEVRRYPPQVIAEAIVEAPDESGGRSKAFRALFDYISGANRSQAKISMTAPVETAKRSETIAMTVPVETSAQAAGRYTMRFFLPAEYDLQSAPQPTDPRVRVLEMPERTLAVLRFTGSRDAQNVACHFADLQAIVKGSRWRAIGEPTTMFYDPPWTIPFLRRNEVAVPVSGG